MEIEIKVDSIKISTNDFIAAYIDGNIEIYGNDIEIKKKCSKRTAKNICNQLNCEWEWGE